TASRLEGRLQDHGRASRRVLRALLNRVGRMTVAGYFCTGLGMKALMSRPPGSAGLAGSGGGVGGGAALLAAADFSTALRARSTALLRSFWLHRPSSTGSRGRRLGEFQWVRSRTAAMVCLVV